MKKASCFILGAPDRRARFVIDIDRIPDAGAERVVESVVEAARDVDAWSRAVNRARI
jgi:hypothetical protein